MKLKNTYWLVGIVTLLLIALLATACGGDAVEEEPAVEEAETIEEEPAPEEEAGEAEEMAETITINFLTWNGPDVLLALDDKIAAWKASDPKWTNVEVQVDAVPFAELFPKIEASVAAGSADPSLAALA